MRFDRDPRARATKGGVIRIRATSSPFNLRPRPPRHLNPITNPQVMSTRMQITFPLFLLLFSGCSGYTRVSHAAQPSQEAFRTEVFQVRGSADVEISTSGGQVDVRGGDRSEVEVRMIVRRNGMIHKPTAKELEDYEIVIEQRDGKVIAKAEKKGSWTWGWGHSNLSISFDVAMPREGTVTGRTSGGSMRASDLRGEVTLRTSGGSITIADVEGTGTIRTSGGSLTIDRHRGSVNGSTSGGSITYRSSEGDFDLSTSGGSIRIEGASGHGSASTSGGSVNAGFDLVDGDIALRTSGGSVSVSIPGGQGYDLDLSGTRVDADLKAFTGDVERDRVEGTLAGGGRLVKARTSGGTVRLRLVE
jgi:DUF4097 and DUF4098 domain-containing protein YvlB